MGARSETWSADTTNALLLGISHALVDTASGFVVFYWVGGHGRSAEAVTALVVAYNAIAFGTQAPFGWLADRFRAWRACATAGTLLAATALLCAPLSVVLAVGVVGVGNSLFHLGAGARVLQRSGERATEAGVFVGPGAVGLFMGIWLGAQRIPAGPALAAILAVAALGTWALAGPCEDRGRGLPRARGTRIALAACLAALLVSVVIRSAVGGSVTAAWKAELPRMAMWFAVAACCGKMIGGLLGDRLGWLPASVGGLLLSGLLFGQFLWNPFAAVAGMVLFQTTMPMTLKATHSLFPAYPAMSFGIPCLALLVGALPALFGAGVVGRPATAMLVLVSTVAVAVGLAWLTRLGASVGPRGAA